MNWHHILSAALITLGFFGAGFGMGMIYGVKQIQRETNQDIEENFENS